MIDPKTVEEIKSRADIVEVVEDFLTLKRSGSNLVALSPFTDEKTPSFNVVPSKGIFKDFSSGKAGNAITFLMELEGMSYVEALKYLANKYGIKIQEDQPSAESIAAQNKRESLFIVLNFASEYFQNSLYESNEGKAIGLTYFKERGFSEETIRKFQLGYAKELWDGLYIEATAKGYSSALLKEAGLITENNGKYFDRFRSRVIFPIHTVSGRPIAFGGRRLSNLDKSAKYINSPETELYFKSKILYGLFQAKSAIRKANNCYLVEGYTDVISMYQAGIENVVSSSGTSLTTEQVQLIKRHSSNVTILFDSDRAGISAAFRGIDMLLEGNLNVKAVALPEGEDPDSYAKLLGTGFNDFLKEQAQDIIRFKAKILIDETETDPVKKSEAVRDIVYSISKIPDPIKRSEYLKECSVLLEIKESILISEQNKFLLKHRKQRHSEPVAMPEALIPNQEILRSHFDSAIIIELQERESIRMLVNYGNKKISREVNDQYLIDYFLNESEDIQFTNKTYNKILELFKEKLKSGEVIDEEYLRNYPDEDVKNTAIDLSINKYRVSTNWKDKYDIHIPHEQHFLKDVMYSNVVRLKFRIIQQLIQEEKKKLKEVVDEQSIDELLDDISNLKEIEVELAKILGNVITG